jgi:hypothetical protein
VLLVIGGVRDLDRHPVTVAQSMGATPGQIYRKVVLPAVLPSVLEGMRLGIIFALLGVLIVEMFAGVRGMGSLLQALGNGFKAADLFAATALVSTLSIAIILGLEAANASAAGAEGREHSSGSTTDPGHGLIPVPSPSDESTKQPRPVSGMLKPCGVVTCPATIARRIGPPAGGLSAGSFWPASSGQLPSCSFSPPSGKRSSASSSGAGPAPTSSA